VRTNLEDWLEIERTWNGAIDRSEASPARATANVEREASNRVANAAPEPVTVEDAWDLLEDPWDLLAGLLGALFGGDD
jgi:hypothetical protein